MLLETDYSSEAFKENINILLLLTGSFPPKPLKTTAHGLPKISRNLSSNGPTFGKKYKKGFLFSNIGIKQCKMGTETAKIALNAHVHLRTANQQMSRPERHVDDITDMRRSCRLRENTSGRRPLGSSSTPRQNVYACARLSISGLFFSHTFQSDIKSPARSCVQRVVQLFCFMLPVLLTIL